MAKLGLSVVSTATSACVPASTVRTWCPSPAVSAGSCNAAANARAATDRPEPGGPVISQAWVIAVGLATAALNVSIACSCPTNPRHTLTGPPPPGPSGQACALARSPHDDPPRAVSRAAGRRDPGPLQPAPPRCGTHPAPASAADPGRPGPGTPAGCGCGTPRLLAPTGPGRRSGAAAGVPGPGRAARSPRAAGGRWRTGTAAPPVRRTAPGPHPDRPPRSPGTGR